MMRPLMIAAATLIAGCSDSAVPPARQDGATIDIGPGTGSGGLALVYTIEWNAAGQGSSIGQDPPDPQDPATPGRDGSVAAARLTEVSMTLADVRVIGDSAVGNNATARDEVELTWTASGNRCVLFASAPPGIYSRVLARVSQYRIAGTTGEGVSFVIADEPPAGLPVSLELDHVAVDVGASTAITAELQPSRVIDAIPWEAVASQDKDPMIIDSESKAIAAVRQAVMSAFALTEEGEAGARCEDDGAKALP